MTCRRGALKFYRYLVCFNDYYKCLVKKKRYSFSGSYPKPGLVILEIYRVEEEHIPYFMDWYPQFGVEQYLVMSNSDVSF